MSGRGWSTVARVLLFVSLLISAAPALGAQAAVAASPSSVLAADALLGPSPRPGPLAAMEQLAHSFRERSASAVDSVLSGDYEFHSANGSRVIEFTRGSARQLEMRVLHNMLEGVRRDGHLVMPPADSVSFTLGDLHERLDPEHADSTDQYCVVTAAHFDMHIVEHNGNTYQTYTSVHVFHLVRGDAAALAPGQSADPSRWYVRRWLENVNEVATMLKREQGDCAPSAATPIADGAVHLRPLGNPACALMTMSCDFPTAEPAHVEVYDVSGRLVNQRDVAVRSAGTLSIDAGEGAHVEPGVYWVRLRQGRKAPDVKMVVVAR